MVKTMFKRSSINMLAFKQSQNCSVLALTAITAVANDEKGQGHAQSLISNGNVGVGISQKTSIKRSIERRNSGQNKHCVVNFTRSSQEVNENSTIMKHLYCVAADYFRNSW
jgi:hypothetical protein